MKNKNLQRDILSYIQDYNNRKINEYKKMKNDLDLNDIQIEFQENRQRKN
jgi:hypothetical protein